MTETQATPEEIARFMSYVDKLPNGCHYWTGGRSRGKGNKKWYGTFWFRGKSIRAHRFAADFIGHLKPLPPGQHRDHTCCFSMCVNAEHLEHVPSKVNQERKMERQRAAADTQLIRDYEAVFGTVESSPPHMMSMLKANGMWPFNPPALEDDGKPLMTASWGY